MGEVTTRLVKRRYSDSSHSGTRTLRRPLDRTPQPMSYPNIRFDLPMQTLRLLEPFNQLFDP